MEIKATVEQELSFYTNVSGNLKIIKKIMCWDYYSYQRFELTLKKGKIEVIKDLTYGEIINKFPDELNESKSAKLYLIRDVEFYQYVGTTFQSINKKLNQDLSSNDLNDYHGYKWKNKSCIELFIWVFKGLNKIEIKSIEAELVFRIREKYKQWPLLQNEIHFNNEFIFGQVLSEDIFNYLESEYLIYSEKKANIDSSVIFKPPNQYGLRGDPYLWKELKANYEYLNIQSENEFKIFLSATFKKITGNDPIPDKVYGVQRYNFGGMSSGAVHCNFWLEKGFPLLIKQYIESQKKK